MTIYERLGVRPVVNAAGTLTRLGGTLMCAEAVRAMNEAARSAVAIDELQEAASRVIAHHTGAEAGLVTSGAFGALVLATGACVAGLDVPRMNRMPPSTQEEPRHEYITRETSPRAAATPNGRSRTATSARLEIPKQRRRRAARRGRDSSTARQTARSISI